MEPTTFRVASGAVVPMPTRWLLESMDKVLVSKDRPLAPPERAKLVSLAKVQAVELIVVAPVPVEKVLAPVIVVAPFKETAPVPVEKA